MATPRSAKPRRYHPYFGKPTSHFAPEFNSTSLDDDALTVLTDVTPLMVSNISLSPITPSARSNIFREDEVPTFDAKDIRRSKSMRKIKALCKFRARRRINLWKPQEVLESTRISETSTAIDTLPSQLPILPNTKQTQNRISEPVECQQSTNLHKGQLKVAIYINSGLLTIHVIQGRHFTSKWKTTCDSYVTVELIPEKSPGCHTDVIRDTNHPIFEEKFSFELLPEDGKKRVLISVYHKTLKSRKSELIGSMSFGLQNITENKAFVNGWYYLLPESIGRRKHLQVSEYYLKKAEQRTKVENPVASPVTYKTHAVLITRGGSGYGFTVTGGCPAKVCRVDCGGPAEVAGLKSGDCIIRINKERVHTASTDVVARIIKHCTRRVLLEVQRPHKTVESMGAQLPWSPMYNDLDSSMSSSEDEDDFAMPSAWYGDIEKENAGRPSQSKGQMCRLRRKVTFRDFH